MPTSPACRRNDLRRASGVVAALLLSAACLGPYLLRLGFPSLYADDLARVAQLQTGTLGQILFVPFNEHVAPLFQAVSWVTWQAAGRRLARAPLAFTMASFLPFPPTLGLLAWVIRRETRSWVTALSAVAAFSLSWLAVETVTWYSASSFLWALLATLAAWLATASAADGGKGSRFFECLAALATSAAPAFSAIGMLAGPVAAVRALAGPGGRKRAALAPLAGTAFTLILYGALHDRAALASNVGQSARLGPGLFAAVRAPAASLVPALFGLKTWQAATPGVAVVQGALTVVAAAVLLWRAYRGHDRPLLLGGLTLIAGGYALTFCARAGEPGRSLLETQRYHLFPMLGFVIILAAVSRRALGRWDASPVGGLWVAAGLSALLFVSHAPEMNGRARFLRFPDQARTLAAIDRLAEVCARLRIDRASALGALDPIERAWTPSGYSALIMLAPPVGIAETGEPSRVKPSLLAAMTPDERQALCGGMDATPYLRAAGDSGPVGSGGRRVALFRVREEGEGRHVSAGWPSFIEYELSGPDARGLGLRASEPGGVVEVWWRGDGGRWSETRSFRLHLLPDASRAGHGWRLPLDQLPHWDTSEARRIRLLYHAPGPVAVSSPRLVR